MASETSRSSLETREQIAGECFEIAKGGCFIREENLGKEDLRRDVFLVTAQKIGVDVTRALQRELVLACLTGH